MTRPGPRQTPQTTAAANASVVSIGPSPSFDDDSEARSQSAGLLREASPFTAPPVAHHNYPTTLPRRPERDKKSL